MQWITYYSVNGSVDFGGTYSLDSDLSSVLHYPIFGQLAPVARLCSNGARSPKATNIWPRATENIFLVARLGDLLVLVS